MIGGLKEILMHGAKEIIEEAAALPVEERAFVADSLLRTLNAPAPEIDHVWCDTAMRRLADLRTGLVKAVSSDDVFDKIKERLERSSRGRGGTRRSN